jgi:hypothetical protein
MMLCRLINGYQCFGETYCLHLQGRNVGAGKFIYGAEEGQARSKLVSIVSLIMSVLQMMISVRVLAITVPFLLKYMVLVTHSYK